MLFFPFFPHELAIFWSAKNTHSFFSTLHPLSLVIFATATNKNDIHPWDSRLPGGNVLYCFSILGSTSIVIHCEATPTQKSAQKLRCDLSQLLSRKITKGIHSCKPAALNCPIGTVLGRKTVETWYGLQYSFQHSKNYVFPVSAFLVHFTLILFKHQEIISDMNNKSHFFLSFGELCYM